MIRFGRRVTGGSGRNLLPSLERPSLFAATTAKRSASSKWHHGTGSAPLTISYHHGLSSTTPLSHDTIGRGLLDTVERLPDRECLVFCEGGHRRTFAQFWKEVEDFAAGLTKIGLKKGDLVGIWGASSLEWAITQFATSLVGIILVNVNPAYQVQELEYAMSKVGCKGIVASTKYKTQDYYQMLNEICPELQSSAPGQLKSKKLPSLSHVIMMGEEQLPGAFRFGDVTAMSSPALVADVHNTMGSLSFDDPINIQFTSGTTGHPKGATLTHHNVVNNARLIGEVVGYPGSDHRICCQVPLYHCFGMVAGLLCMSTSGVTNIFPAAGYDPRETVKSLVSEKATMIYGTPTMFVDACSLVESEKVDLPHLKKGVIAGSPCAVELVKKAESSLGIFMHIAYGSTETSPVVLLTDESHDNEKRVSSVGKTIPHTENMISDEEGKPVPIGQHGEIKSRGYCVMLKYWNDEEKTSSAIDQHNWYHSGDVGTMDEEGYVRITGRLKDMIIRGGENVYPTEIENFLHKHPKIDDAQVFGVPSERLGEELAVWIRLKEGESMTPEDVQGFCKGKLSHFKVPKYIKFVDDYPLTVTRKVQKYKMRETYAKELGL